MYLLCGHAYISYLQQSERLAQERKVLNWEKLFSKMMVSIDLMVHEC